MISNHEYFFALLAHVNMDSRLRGNDNGITWALGVIPVKAGIYADADWQFKESIHIYFTLC